MGDDVVFAVCHVVEMKHQPMPMILDVISMYSAFQRVGQAPSLLRAKPEGRNSAP